MRVSSGIGGFDELAGGGFPENTVNLVSGPAGSAKSLFGMQFAYGGAAEYDEPGIFISLEESRESVMRAAKAYGMDIAGCENLQLIDFGQIRADMDMDKELDMGVVSFRNIRPFIENLMENNDARRLVIDSISAIGLYYSNTEELRREMFSFCRFLNSQDLTSVLVTEAMDSQQTRFGVEQFVADSIVSLGYENVNGEYRRTITIYKMRFTKHEPYKHPFLITDRGMEIDSQEIIY